MAILAVFIIAKYVRAINYRNIVKLNVTDLIDKSILDDKYEMSTLYHKEGCNFEVRSYC
jgi:hypothetical protein